MGNNNNNKTTVISSKDTEISEKDLIATHRIKREREMTAILKERKESTFPIGVEIRPYNREKKANLFKLILVTLTKVSGTISRKMIGKNFEYSQCSELLSFSQVPAKGVTAKQFEFNQEKLRRFTEAYGSRFIKKIKKNKVI